MWGLIVYSVAATLILLFASNILSLNFSRPQSEPVVATHAEKPTVLQKPEIAIAVQPSIKASAKTEPKLRFRKPLSAGGERMAAAGVPAGRSGTYYAPTPIARRRWSTPRGMAVERSAVSSLSFTETRAQRFVQLHNGTGRLPSDGRERIAVREPVAKQQRVSRARSHTVLTAVANNTPRVPRAVVYTPLRRSLPPAVEYRPSTDAWRSEPRQEQDYSTAPTETYLPSGEVVYGPYVPPAPERERDQGGFEDRSWRRPHRHRRRGC